MIPYWTNGSILLDNFDGIKFSRSKSLSLPPTVTGQSAIPKSTSEIPLTPFIQFDQAVSFELPIGDKIPRPVTTTLLCSCMQTTNYWNLCNL